MIRLVGITKTESKVVCDAFVDGCKTAMRLVFDLDSMELEPYTLPKGYEYAEYHTVFARRAIREMIDAGEFPESKLIMWG